MIREYLITAAVLIFGLAMYEMGRADEREDTQQVLGVASARMDSAAKAMDSCITTLEKVATWTK